jgi:hypothetical protein
LPEELRGGGVCLHIVVQQIVIQQIVI